MDRKKSALMVILAAVLFASAGCDTLLKSFVKKGPPLPKPSAKTDEELLRKACEAIGRNDWEAFRQLTALEIDFITDQMKLGTKQAQSGRFAELRQQNLDEMRAAFDRAVAGGEHQIDFQSAKFAGVGTGLEAAYFQTDAATVSFYYRSFSLKMDLGQGVENTIELMPAFWIADWRGKPGQPMIVHLDFRLPWRRSRVEPPSDSWGRSEPSEDYEEADSDDDDDGGYEDYSGDVSEPDPVGLPGFGGDE